MTHLNVIFHQDQIIVQGFPAETRCVTGGHRFREETLGLHVPTCQGETPQCQTQSVVSVCISCYSNVLHLFVYFSSYKCLVCLWWMLISVICRRVWYPASGWCRPGPGSPASWQRDTERHTEQRRQRDRLLPVATSWWDSFCCHGGEESHGGAMPARFLLRLLLDLK